MPKRKKPLINDPLAPTKQRIRLPSGRKVTLKRKKAYDKGRFDTEMREQYLTLIREGVTNKDAAAACGCGTKYFQRRRKEDPDFEQAYQDARADGDDVIRAEVKRRGVDGVKQAIYHDGKVVGHKQVYSDNLLMFLAKSRMPEEFGDRQTTEHIHKFEGAAEQLVDKMASILGVAAPSLPPKNPDVIDAEYTEVEK
jgi:hypothetical protein